MRRGNGLIVWCLIFGLIGSVALAAGPNGTDDNKQTPVCLITPLAPNLAGLETRLLPANYDVWSCDWSPDSKAMVFAGKIQGEDATKMRIWYWAQDPVSDPVPLTASEELIDSMPRWSPDGTKVVMTRRSYNKSGSTSVTSTIWLKELDGGSGKRLTNGPEDRDPSWSTDATQVVFGRGKGPYQAQLVIVNLADNSAKVLAGRDGELLNSPFWGKDGKVYFTKLTPSPKNVIVANQTYQVMDFGRGGIWAINPRDGKTEAVVVDEYDNRQPALSPDGAKLAFVSNRVPTKEGNGKFDRGSLFVKNLASGEIFYVTSKVGLNGGSLSWSPDGKRLAFFTFRSIRPAVWVINLP